MRTNADYTDLVDEVVVMRWQMQERRHPVQIRITRRVCYGIRTKPCATPFLSNKLPVIPKASTKAGFRRSLLSFCCALPCVPAISRQPKRQHAQAREGEAEKLRRSLRYLDGSSFRSFLSVFTPVLRKSGRKVMGKVVGWVMKYPPSAEEVRAKAEARARPRFTARICYARTTAIRWRNSSSTSPGTATVWAISSRNNVW